MLQTTVVWNYVKVTYWCWSILVHSFLPGKSYTNIHGSSHGTPLSNPRTTQEPFLFHVLTFPRSCSHLWSQNSKWNIVWMNKLGFRIEQIPEVYGENWLIQHLLHMDCGSSSYLLYKCSVYIHSKYFFEG